MWNSHKGEWTVEDFSTTVELSELISVYEDYLKTYSESLEEHYEKHPSDKANTLGKVLEGVVRGIKDRILFLKAYPGESNV
jgi:hypothetical protein